MKCGNCRPKDLTGPVVSSFLCDLGHTSVVARRLLADWLSGKPLSDVMLNPSAYEDATAFGVDYQAQRLLKKFPSLPGVSPKERAHAALLSFMAAEEACKTTNLRLARIHYGHDVELGRLLLKARGWVSSVLGKFSWDSVVLRGMFGPGASVGVKRRDSHLIKKIGHERPTVTGACKSLLDAYVLWDPTFGKVCGPPRVVSGSSYGTVPKDAKKDRSICTEPLWNMFFQKGIGACIRSRLRRIGLDLSKQQFLNRSLAQKGSLDGSLSTLDLSSASDSVSLSLCELLLPKDWYEAMLLTRSPTVLIGGEEVVLRKMSSMGNGFTFELESLIFLALTWVCCPVGRRRVNVDIAVYGDDIICPTDHVSAVSSLLKQCGFTVNPEKSFTSGPFRESCGGHYFSGIDVTPFHLNKELATWTDVFWAMNSLRMWGWRLNSGLHSHKSVRDTWELLFQALPRRLQHLRIPFGFGDVGIVSSFDECAPTTAKKHSGGWEGFTFKGLVPIPHRYEEYDGDPALLAFLWLTKSGACDDGLEFYRREPLVTRLKVVDLFTHQQWPHIGPISA